MMANVVAYPGFWLQVPFTAPAYPGEMLRTEMWTDGDIVSFRTRAPECDAVVLGNGRIDLAAA